jgi:hypothetical protein
LLSACKSRFSVFFNIADSSFSCEIDNILRAIASSISLPRYEILSATFTIHPSHVNGANWLAFSMQHKSTNSFLGKSALSSTSPQWHTIPSLTA